MNDIHIIDLGTDATNEDLVEQIRQMNRHREMGVEHVGCTIRGFGDDPRDLWQIADVVDFCKRLVRTGFIAGLDVTTTFAGGGDFPPGIKPFGALEIWLIANGHMRNGQIQLTQELFGQFTRDLEYLNSVADDLVGK